LSFSNRRRLAIFRYIVIIDFSSLDCNAGTKARPPLFAAAVGGCDRLTQDDDLVYQNRERPESECAGHDVPPFSRVERLLQ
jgi:hypothetical protein